MPNPMTEEKPRTAPHGTTAEPEDPAQTPIDLERFPEQTFFALFDDRYVAGHVAERIEDAGMDADRVEVLAGQEGVARLAPEAEEPHGLMERLVRMAEELSDFKAFLSDCAATVNTGKALLMASFEDEADRTAAELLVRQGGGAPLAYTEKWTLVKYV